MPVFDEVNHASRRVSCLDPEMFAARMSALADDLRFTRMRPVRAVGGQNMRRVAFVLSLLTLLSCSKAVERSQPVAPRLQNLGGLHVPVTTTTSEAQRFFDQGLTFLYAFNHYEAERSFREAQRLDPKCAMCAWEALALGPNINDPVPDNRHNEDHFEDPTFAFPHLLGAVPLFAYTRFGK